MGKTIAEALKEEGRKEGELKAAFETRRQTLVRQLQKRFGDIPDAAVAVLQATRDLERLDEWLDRTVTARTLDEVGIQ